MEITVNDFMLMQPNYPRVTDSDKYYFQLAMRLADLCDGQRLLALQPEHVRRRVVLAVMGYYQDVVADSGLWRSFTMMHERMYGTPLPFYGRSADYVDYELNVDDLRFVIWYTIEGLTFDNGRLSPLDREVERAAREFFKVLNECYEEAPNPVEYNLVTGIETGPESDAASVYELSRWLFFKSFLMPPAAKVALAQNRAEARRLVKEGRRDLEGKLTDLDDRTMLTYPTGPLSLTIGQWVKLIASGELPGIDPADDAPSDAEPHKHYTRFTKATGGSEIAFFADYDALNSFLTGPMEWGDGNGGDVFPQLRGHSHFVMLAHRAKGVLIAPDVAQFICHPANALYDRAQARAAAHTLITDYGRCPADLVRYAFGHGLVPDAALPADPTGRLLLDNWDFMARLYQQGLYTHSGD